MQKLNPDNLLTPNHAAISGILAQYNLQLSRYEPVATGIVNLTLVVWTNTGNQVLRVYAQNAKTNQDILLEIDFMATLKRKGLPIPAVFISSHGQPLVTCDIKGKTWQCLLMEYAPGEHPTGYTQPLVQNLARLQATMHITSQDYAKKNHLRPSSNKLEATPATHKLPSQSTDPYFGDFFERAEHFTVKLGQDLPYGITHLDYDIDNVFVHNDSVTAILDFGDIACTPLIVCLGYTLWDILFEYDGSPTNVGLYLQAYEAVRPLTSAERAILPQIILFRHYMITAVQRHLGTLTHNSFDQAIKQEQTLKHYPIISVDRF